MTTHWAGETFKYRMEFMELWEQGRFDLIQFTIGQRKKLHNTFKELRKIEIAHDVTQEPGDFIKMCNNGSITEEDFLSYGPHLAVRWLHAQQDRGRNKQRELDEEQEAVEQAETEYQAMKKAVDIPNEDPFEVKVDYPVSNPTVIRPQNTMALLTVMLGHVRNQSASGRNPATTRKDQAKSYPG